MPCIDIRQPPEGNGRCPQTKASRLEVEHSTVACRLGVEPDPEDEAPDPAEHLRVAVALHPGRGQASHTMVSTDGHQV